MFGKLGIAFFILLALWLLWKSVIQPLLSTRTQQKAAKCIGWMITYVLLGIFVLLLIALLHLFGSGVIELITWFGFEKLVER